MDTNLVVWLMIALLGVLGLVRGVRAEGITLAVVLAAGVVFSNEAIRGRVVAMINRVPRVVELMLAPEGVAPAAATFGLIVTPDQRLFFYLAGFVVCAALGYYAGWRWGTAAGARSERLLGGLMGAVSGFVTATTLLGFSQDYLARNPNVPGFAIELPRLVAPALPAPNVLVQYAPLVFLGAFAVMAAVVVVSVVKR